MFEHYGFLKPVQVFPPQIIPQELLKKYITYAKLNVFPKLHDGDLDKLTQVYAELRRESSVRLSFVEPFFLDYLKYANLNFLLMRHSLTYYSMCMYSMDKEFP